MKQLQSCLIFITILVNVIPGLGLKDVEIILPRYVRQGVDIRLSCKYDLEKEVLYAIKWYKGPGNGREFFRYMLSLIYLPKESPPAQAFQLPGITVDVLNSSSNSSVVLRNVSLESSGQYRCVVAAEFPFQTLHDSADMIVVVTGDDMPRLQLESKERSQYHPGDVVSAVCQSPPSFPPANITWYIDDIKVEHGRIKTELRKEGKDPFARSTMSNFSFDLPGTGKVAMVKISCRASVFSVYDRVSNVTTIEPIPRRLTGTETLLRPGSSRASSTSSPPLILQILAGLQIFATTRHFQIKLCSTLS